MLRKYYFFKFQFFIFRSNILIQNFVYFENLEIWKSGNLDAAGAAPPP